MARTKVDVRDGIVGPSCNLGVLVNGCSPEVGDEAAGVANHFKRCRFRSSEQDSGGTAERLDVLLNVTEAFPDHGRDVAFAAEVGIGGQ